MLYQNYSFEQSQNQIFSVLKELQIAKLLYKANIRKGCGLSAFEIDPVFHEFVRGFNLLALGWSYGFSFIPVSFVLLSSAKLRNRYQEADKDIDHRTNGWKARMEMMNLFLETINGYGTEDTEIIKSKVVNWIASQSRYIKGLFQNLCWES